MPLMSWDESYSVQIPSIDAQHKRMIQMINKLYDGIESGQSRESLGETLNDLIAYVQYHFEYEETLFDRTGYPMSEEHSKEHQELRERVMQIKKEFDEEDIATLPHEVLFFLQDWLKDHIKGTDMQYSEHFLQKGVE